MIRQATFLGMALLATAAVTLAAAGNPNFMKLPEGRNISKQTGKPIAAFAFIDSKGKTPSC